VWKASSIPHRRSKNILLGFPIKLKKTVCSFRTVRKPDGTDTSGQYNKNRERKTMKGEWRKENYRKRKNRSRERV
jgi:hypothetical protein